MSVSDYNFAMHCLDNIVDALNDIALNVGHPTYDEFFNKD